MHDLFIKNENGIKIFLFSFLTLYLELALIRFTSAEVIYLGYFSNFILISVFLGIGLGFLVAERSIHLFRFTPQLILFLIAFILFTHIDVTALRKNIGQLFFGKEITVISKFPLWIGLVLIFSLIVFIFAGIAQETARCFNAYQPIIAYSIDIVGSLIGILVFSLHAYSETSPITWFILSFTLIAVLSYRYSIFNAAAMGFGVLLLLYSVVPNHFVKWSPYQRIDVWPIEKKSKLFGYHLAANGIGHQSMQPVGTKEPFYEYAYTDILKKQNKKRYEDVLIIGSGAGTDVSYALHYGSKRIDAVEIDPVIQKAGSNFHPLKPFSDKRVSIFVNDGRAFMEKTKKTYDLIIYALPDSLASLSNFANIRLESFLFTTESFQQAKKLLKEDGVFVLYNYYRKKWLVKKIHDMLNLVFEHPPLVRIYSTESMGLQAAFAIGPTIYGKPLKGIQIPPATDNWPFLYMQKPYLPLMYLWIILLFVGCGFIGVLLSRSLTIKNLRDNGAFLFMGAAFLLLETKSLIQFFLIFGATWIVNALVFSGILISILIANLMICIFDFKKPVLFFLLLLSSLLLQIIFPFDSLLKIQNLFIRYIAASLVFFSPIFFANLVFGFLFKGTPRAASAFGWNIIGVMIGGALEYLSIAIGYRSLTIVILGLYSICFIWTYWVLHGRRKLSL